MTLTREQIDNWRACFRAAFKHNPFDRPQIDALCDMSLRSLDVGQAPKTDVHFGSGARDGPAEHLASVERDLSKLSWAIVHYFERHVEMMKLEGWDDLSNAIHETSSTVAAIDAGATAVGGGQDAPITPKPDGLKPSETNCELVQIPDDQIVSHGTVTTITAPSIPWHASLPVPDRIVSVAVLEAERKALEKAEQLCIRVGRDWQSVGESQKAYAAEYLARSIRFLIEDAWRTTGSTTREDAEKVSEPRDPGDWVIRSPRR